jgi:hypothetical protein
MTISILILTDHQFWLQDRGDRKRISELVKYLATQFSVDVLYLSKERLKTHDELAIKAQYKIRDITSVTYQFACSRNRLLIFWFAYRTLPACLFNILQKIIFRLSPVMEAQDNTERIIYKSKTNKFFLGISKLIGRRVAYNIVIIEYLRLTTIAKKLKQLIPQSHFIIDTHDVTYLREQSFRLYGKSTGSNLTRDSEAKLLDFYDLIIGISIDDCIAFSNLVQKPVLHVGHPRSSLSNLDLDPSCQPHDSCQILFMGTGGEANVDSVQILITEVLPLLNKSCERPFLFHIVGEVCNDSRIKSLASSQCNPAVIWHGYVSQPTSYYALADIVCNPVRIGGGLKIKNIEAICHHCVLVTTSEGAKGLPSFPDPYFIRADTSTSQASAMARLVNNPRLLQSYQMNAAKVSEILHPMYVYRDLEMYVKQTSLP